MPVKYSKELLQEAVTNSESFTGVLRYLGAGQSGSVHGHIKRRIQGYGIDYSHFTHRNSLSQNKKMVDNDSILILLPKGSKRTPRSLLLRALADKKVPYRCNKCSIGTLWQGENLNLEIDHKDGNCLNNTLDNLQFLCPNCHSQTESNNRSRAYNPYFEESIILTSLIEAQTTARKEKQKVPCPTCGFSMHYTSKLCRQCNAAVIPRKEKIKWPAVETLIKAVKDTSYTAVANSLGVSDNAVRKRINAQGYSTKTFKKL